MVNYNTVTENVIEEIKNAVSGKTYVGEEINIDFFHDEMPIYGEGQPELVVDATNAEEIAKVVKICNDNKIPVVPRLSLIHISEPTRPCGTSRMPSSA